MSKKQKFDHNHQKLIDICFELVGTAMDSETIRKLSHADRMEWVIKQLKQCGFDTAQVGSSWGVLK